MSGERDFEGEAKSSGWLPQDQWKGPPEKWVDAQKFVERGEQFFPFVQAKLKKSLDKIDTLEATVNELRGGNEEFRRFHEGALAKEKREREALIAKYEAERTKAVTEGDGVAFQEAESKLAEARAQPAPAAPVKPGLSPEAQAWMVENPWYTTDRRLKAIADGLSDELAAEQPNLKGRPFLDELAKRVKEEVPQKFSTPRVASTQGNQGSPAVKAKERTYDALPAEARAACDRFVKTIPGFTKEAYVASYDWS